MNPYRLCATNRSHGLLPFGGTSPRGYGKVVKEEKKLQVENLSNNIPLMKDRGTGGRD